MASTLSFLPPASRKTPLPIVLVGSPISLGPRWRDYVSNYTSPLVNRLSEENYPHPVSLHTLLNHRTHPQAARDLTSWARKYLSRIARFIPP